MDFDLSDLIDSLTIPSNLAVSKKQSAGFNLLLFLEFVHIVLF